MSNEQKLTVKTNVGSNGKEYKNLVLKTKVDKTTGAVEQGLLADHYAVLTKKYNEGKQTQYGYVVSAEYEGEEVSFFLNEREHALFVEAGGVDEQIIAKLEPYAFKKDGKDIKGSKLVFERA